MRDAANDNSTWISIGLAAALIFNKLRNQSQLTEVEPIHEGDVRRDGHEQSNESADGADKHACRDLAQAR